MSTELVEHSMHPKLVSKINNTINIMIDNHNAENEYVCFFHQELTLDEYYGMLKDLKNELNKPHTLAEKELIEKEINYIERDMNRLIEFEAKIDSTGICSCVDLARSSSWVGSSYLYQGLVAARSSSCKPVVNEPVVNESVVNESVNEQNVNESVIEPL